MMDSLLLVLFVGEKFDQLDFFKQFKDEIGQALGVSVQKVATGFPDCHKRKDQCLANDFLSGVNKLRNKFKTDYALAVTEKDLYVEEMNFVFGLALPKDKSAIISTHRLRDREDKLYLERAVKEAIHEVGHLKGLEHCPNAKCVMHFSNALKDTDIKGKTFCPKCQEKL
jgi:archaemetzincin